MVAPRRELVRIQIKIPREIMEVLDQRKLLNGVPKSVSVTTILEQHIEDSHQKRSGSSRRK